MDVRFVNLFSFFRTVSKYYVTHDKLHLCIFDEKFLHVPIDVQAECCSIQRIKRDDQTQLS